MYNECRKRKPVKDYAAIIRAELTNLFHLNCPYLSQNIRNIESYIVSLIRNKKKVLLDAVTREHWVVTAQTK